MKKFVLILILLMLEGLVVAQDTAVKAVVPKNNFFIHYYPLALVMGDISLGGEHLHKSKFGEELSLNIKTFRTSFYEYNKGYRIDYLIKYILLNRKRFRFTANLSFEYKNIYFKNKPINHYYLSSGVNEPEGLFETLLEDRRQTSYGAGIGLSVNFRIHKKLYFGADITMNFIKYRVKYNYKEIIYRDPNGAFLSGFPVPYTSTSGNSTPALSPMLRLKLTYKLEKPKFKFLKK